MEWIVLAFSVANADICYATAPVSYAVAQQTLEGLAGWRKTHVGYSIPTIVPQTDPRYTRALSGITRQDTVFNRTVTVPPCRIFGTD